MKIISSDVRRYLLLCVSFSLHGASSSQVQDKTLDLKSAYFNKYDEVREERSFKVKYANVAKCNRHRRADCLYRKDKLNITPDWHSDLSKPDSNYMIAQALTASWNPLEFWYRDCNYGKVAPIIVDIRYVPIDQENTAILRDNPPSPHTRVIVNTKAVDDRNRVERAQISEHDVATINNAWRRQVAQYDQRSFAQVVVDTAYKLRYYLATASVAYAGYRYMQSNHATWVNQQLAERNNIIAIITNLQHQVDTLQSIIVQAREGVSTNTVTQVAHAFDTINRVENELSRVKLLLSDMPEWDSWSSLLKTIKDKWFLLIKSLGATWLFDIYIVRKLLAYAPFEYPSIEIRNDIRAYNCERVLHGHVFCTSYPGGYACCSEQFKGPAYAPAILTDEQKAVFDRNRKIAGYATLMGLSIGSFYAGRMLYRNADKIMAMLPK